jgi:hypothetical protein
MSNLDDPTRALFARMQALGHIRLARGVVGKASVVAGIAILVLGGIAWRIDSGLLPMMAGAVLLAFFAYLAAVLWFAHRHPEQALLEGAEIIQYREQEMAKGVIELPHSAPTTPEPLPARLPEK